MMAAPAMKARVAEEEGVVYVLAAMRAHPMATGVQLNATAVLKEFVSHPKTLEHLKRGNAREVLSAATKNHPFNHDLIKIAEETIHYLPL